MYVGYTTRYLGSIMIMGAYYVCRVDIMLPLQFYDNGGMFSM